MKIYLYLLTTLFLYPYLTGLLWHRIWPKKICGLSSVFAFGYVTELAVFECIAVPYFADGKTTLEMWPIFIRILTALSAAGFLLNLKDTFRIPIHAVQGLLQSKWHKKVLVAVMALLVVLSVTVVRPTEEDDTLEVILTNEATGTYYEYNPYSGMPYGGIWLDKVDAPTELYYTMLIDKTGMSAKDFLYGWMDVSLLLFFYSVIWAVGEEVVRKESFSIYLATVLMISMMSLVMPRSAYIAVFQNLWMDTTLLFTCIAPLAFYVVVLLLHGVWEKDNKIILILRYILLSAVVLLAAQLCYHYSMLWLGITMGVGLLIEILWGAYLALKKPVDCANSASDSQNGGAHE